MLSLLRKTAQWIVVKIILLTVQTGIAQEPNFRQITVENGLTSNTVYQILQDKHGYVWSCGDAGISRFDGKDFLNFTVNDGLQDNEVVKIIESTDNKIWYLTLKGKLGYVKSGKINRLDSINVKLGNKVVDIQPCDKRCVLVFTRDSLIFHFQNDCLNFQRKSLNKMLLTHTVQFNGRYGERITIATPYDVIDHVQFEVTSHSNSIFNSEDLYNVPDNIRSEGPIFFVNAKCYRYLGDGISKVGENPILKESNVFSCLNLNGNKALVGTDNGVFLINTAGNQVKVERSFLSGKKVSAIQRTLEGNFIFATLGDGIIFWPNERINVNNNLAKLTALAYDTKTRKLFCGDEIGQISTLDIKSKTCQTLGPTLTNSDRIISLSNTKSGILVTTDYGLFYANERGSSTESRLKYFLPKTILKEDSVLWVGTWDSLKKTKNGVTKTILKGRTTAIYRDKFGSLWFSNDIGLHELKDNNIINHAPSHSLFRERFVKIEQDINGNLWLASQGKGLICYSLKSKKVFSIDTRHGLADNVCNSFFIDSNKIWVATNAGIGKITFLDNNKRNYTIQNIGVKQGLPSNSIRQIIKVDDDFYVATGKGLAYFKEKDVKINDSPPPIYISGLKLRDRDTSLRTSYTFDYDDNNIRISYIGIAFRAQGSVRYLYKLEGLDTTWQSTNYNSVGYPSLPPGEYNFFVKAINEDGIESIAPAKLSIVIMSPFWHRWWFWLIMVLSLGGLSALFIRTRFRLLQKQSALKQQVAESEQKALRTQMNPHFVFNALNSIHGFIAQNETRDANMYLAKFGKLIRTIFQNSAYKSISIGEELEVLSLYLELESMRFGDRFEYRIDSNGAMDIYNMEVPSMIVQPYIENSIWHGIMHKPTKGSVTLSIEPYRDGALWIIEDTGIGREAAAKNKKGSDDHKSSAMTLTAQRLKILSESSKKEFWVKVIDLKDEDGKATGTRVEVFLSFIEPMV